VAGVAGQGYQVQSVSQSVSQQVQPVRLRQSRVVQDAVACNNNHATGSVQHEHWFICRHT
jgi:hypothetical protein